DVGYESEAAFNRAFKRVTGLTPGRWRSGAADSAQADAGVSRADA
ncbi:helix-turn-helix domain-containing protein, partial [Rhizobium leguminosarum]